MQDASASGFTRNRVFSRLLQLGACFQVLSKSSENQVFIWILTSCLEKRSSPPSCVILCPEHTPRCLLSPLLAAKGSKLVGSVSKPLAWLPSRTACCCKPSLPSDTVPSYRTGRLLLGPDPREALHILISRKWEFLGADGVSRRSQEAAQ